MPYATSSDGVRIYYETLGSGPPLLLCHGTTSTHYNWKGLGYVDALEDDFQLILMDLRGHGASDKRHDPADYVFTQQARDAVAVLDDAGVERAHFWGHSAGAGIGFHLGAGYPARVQTLMLWGFHPYAASPEDLAFREWVVATLRQGIGAWVGRMDTAGVLAQFRDPERARKLRLAEDADALVAAMLGGNIGPGVGDALPQMTMPCLLMAGQRDHFGQLAQQASVELPHADFVLLSGLGHAMCRAEVGLPYVRAFLERVRQGAFPDV
jgi:pimeloyl-ACP methyl ester carboxylesterase